MVTIHFLLICVMFGAEMHLAAYWVYFQYSRVLKESHLSLFPRLPYYRKNQDVDIA